jgi:hypothetical protein
MAITGTGVGSGPAGGFKLRHSKLKHTNPGPKQQIQDKYKPQIRLLQKQIKQALQTRKTASPTTRAQINNTLFKVRNNVRELQIQRDRQLSQIPMNQQHKRNSDTIHNESPPKTEKAQ